MELNASIREYLNWKKGSRPRAAQMYANYIKNFCKSVACENIEEVTLRDVVKYQADLAARMKSSTVAYALTALRDWLSFWSDQHLNVLRPRLIIKPRYSNESHETLPPEIFAKFDNLLRHDDFVQLRTKLAINILWHSGCRVSELCSLDIENTLEKGRITFITRKAVIKAFKKRVLRMPESLQFLLEKYIGIRKELCSCPALFIELRTHQRISIRSLQRWVAELCEHAGCPGKYTPHSFRHGYSVKRRRDGASLPFVQRALGHTNPLSTQIYMQYGDKEFDEEQERYW